MPAVGFELTIPASTRPQTYAVDRAATGIDKEKLYEYKMICAVAGKVKVYVAERRQHGTCIILSIAHQEIIINGT
jgi:hypothetical protein